MEVHMTHLSLSILVEHRNESIQPQRLYLEHVPHPRHALDAATVQLEGSRTLGRLDVRGDQV